MGVQDEVLKRFATFKSKIRIANTGQVRFTIPSAEREKVDTGGDFRIAVTNLDADGVVDQRDKIVFKGSITSQGRVTIPSEYSETLEADDGDIIQVFMKKSNTPESDSIKTIKKSLADLRGSLSKFDFEK